MSDPNSAGEISANKSVRSGIEVKGTHNRSVGSEEAAAQEMA